jgi:hypothetical protein
MSRFAQHGVKVPADVVEIVGRPQVESVVLHPGLSPQVSEGCTVTLPPTWYGHLDDSRCCSLTIGQGSCPPCCSTAARSSSARTHGAAAPHHSAAALRRLRLGSAAHLRASRGVGADAGRLLQPRARTHLGRLERRRRLPYSEKPLAIVDLQSHVSAERFLEELPIARVAYVLRADAVSLELDGLLQDLLVPDRLASPRHLVK